MSTTPHDPHLEDDRAAFRRLADLYAQALAADALDVSFVPALSEALAALAADLGVDWTPPGAPEDLDEAHARKAWNPLDVVSRPLASQGLNSYRYRGRWGFVMVGAHDDAHALREAGRSIEGEATMDRLERWDGSRYVPLADPAEPVAYTPASTGLTIHAYGNGLVVRGNTRAFKGQLKALGGRWNARLDDGPGWVFPLSKREALGDLVRTGTPDLREITHDEAVRLLETKKAKKPAKRSAEPSKALVLDEDNAVPAAFADLAPGKRGGVLRGTERVSLDDSIKALRKALHDAFAPTTFSVRRSRGTGYGNVHVTWTDGPSRAMVQRVAGHFSGEGYDSSTDMPYHKVTDGPDGMPRRYEIDLILYYREHSDAYVRRAVAAFKETRHVPTGTTLSVEVQKGYTRPQVVIEPHSMQLMGEVNTFIATTSERQYASPRALRAPEVRASVGEFGQLTQTVVRDAPKAEPRAEVTSRFRAVTAGDWHKDRHDAYIRTVRNAINALPPSALLQMGDALQRIHEHGQASDEALALGEGYLEDVLHAAPHELVLALVAPIPTNALLNPKDRHAGIVGKTGDLAGNYDTLAIALLRACAEVENEYADDEWAIFNDLDAAGPPGPWKRQGSQSATLRQKYAPLLPILLRHAGGAAPLCDATGRALALFGSNHRPADVLAAQQEADDDPDDEWTELRQTTDSVALFGVLSAPPTGETQQSLLDRFRVYDRLRSGETTLFGTIPALSHEDAFRQAFVERLRVNPAPCPCSGGAALAYFGKVVNVSVDVGRGKTRTFRDRMAFMTADGRSLIIVPRRRVKRVRAVPRDPAARAQFERFHHYNASGKGFFIDVPDTPSVAIGTARDIRYLSDKVMRSDDRKGKLNGYHHDFDTGQRPVTLHGDVLVIDRLEIDGRGILN